MPTIKIPNSEIQNLLSEGTVEFPKYSTQIMNLANQNAQGTRPKVVGQMSDLIQEFKGKTLQEWRIFYEGRKPDGIKDAADKIYPMIELFKEAITKIDKEMVEKWVDDLVILKTFAGLNFQETILRKLSEIKNEKYRLATPYEEAQGIDGFIGETSLSIKPNSYKTMFQLQENIAVGMVYYEKKDTGLVIEYNF